MKRWFAVIAMCLVGVALNFALLEYGKSVTTTYIGNRTVSTRPDTPILYVLEVADTFCPSGKPDEPCAFATFRGFFARSGVSRLVGLTCGAALPCLLLIAAAVHGLRRKWVTVAGFCLACLVLFGFFVDVPVRYFDAPIGTDIRQLVAADAIWISHIDVGTEDCSPTKWVKPIYCTKHEFAFANGAFPTRGIPRLFAIGAGIVLPILLMFFALVFIVSRRLSRGQLRAK